MAEAFVDPYLEPGTRVLKNRPNLRSPTQLARYENRMSSLRLTLLELEPIKGNFDLKHMQAIHKYLFQDVYDWAGKLREVNIGKGLTFFATVENLEREGAAIGCVTNEANNFRGLGKTEFVGALTDIYADWNALHPFREGNGRATRAMLGQLCKEAGYVLDQRRIDNGKEQWNKAAEASFGRDLDAMHKTFEFVVRPARSVAFEQADHADAIRAHPDLATAVAVYGKLEELVSSKISDIKSQQMMLAGARHSIIKTLDSGIVKVDPSVVVQAAQAAIAPSPALVTPPIAII